jgi:hypothetical protein
MTSPRFERFLKPKEKRGGQPPKEKEENTEEDPKSLYEILKQTGKSRWLAQNHPLLLANFNLFNKTLHPNRPLANGIATVCLKGTTFEDKRTLGISLAERLHNHQDTGEIELVPDPTNPHDPNALGAYDTAGNLLGYIPKAQGLNKCYIDAIAKNQLCGAYIADTKISDFKGNKTAILTIATGWKTQQ